MEIYVYWVSYIYNATARLSRIYLSLSLSSLLIFLFVYTTGGKIYH